MKTLIALTLAGLFACGTAPCAADDGDPKMTPQQEKMKACNAAGRPTRNRSTSARHYMKTCL